MPNHFILIFFYYERCRDFARKSKSRGGTLVACVYFKESTYSWNIQSAGQKKSRFAWTGAAWNLWVMMTFLLFYCSSSSSGRAQATIAVIICCHLRKTQHKLTLLINTSIAFFPSLNVGFTRLLGHKLLPNQQWKEREGKPRKRFNNYDRDRGVHAHSCIMGNQGKMTGNSKICTGIQSQLILPEFIYLPRSPWKG